MVTKHETVKVSCEARAAVLNAAARNSRVRVLTHSPRESVPKTVQQGTGT